MFKLANLTDTQVNQLPSKLKEEVLFVKENTENFQEEYFEIFEDNDTRLHRLVEGELAKKETPKPKPIEAKTPTKATKEPKAPVKKVTVNQSPKEKKSVSKEKKTVNEEPKLSYLKKVPEPFLQKSKKVKLSCNFQAITAPKDMEVIIKNKVKKGEHLLVHEDGYLFAAMTNYGYNNRCVEVKDDNIVEKTNPQSKKQEKQKKEAPSKKKTPDFIQKLLDNPPAPLLTWLDGQIELWKNRQTNKKITKIMILKESNDVIIEMTHFDKILRVADLRLTYHSIHPETAKLKKVPAPLRGSYRLLVSKTELKEQYSTKRNWNICRKWIREAYACSKASNCSPKQKELYKKYYDSCGDLVAKEENIEYLRWLHRKAGEIWKRGEESYLEAFGRGMKILRNLKN